MGHGQQVRQEHEQELEREPRVHAARHHHPETEETGGEHRRVGQQAEALIEEETDQRPGDEREGA